MFNLWYYIRTGICMCSSWLLPIYWSTEYKCYYVWQHDINRIEQLDPEDKLDFTFQLHNRTGKADHVQIWHSMEDGHIIKENTWWDDEFETYWHGGSVKPDFLS